MTTTLIIILVVGLFLVALTIKKLLFICQPNEVLIFSGGVSRHGDRRVLYKPIKGGRKIKIPLFEVVDQMDLTNMAINVAVSGAFSRGGIPLEVDGVANIKVAGEEPLLGNAVERIMGKPREAIVNIAKETLEGNLRGVLATLTPEEVNSDKIAFAQKLMDEADHDLNRLGLVLDTLKIQNVSDSVGYLDSIGRISGAEVRKKAIIAEANAKSAAMVKDAENVRETELVRLGATIRTMQAEAARKVRDAETQQAALIAESQGQIAAEVVQAKAEMDVQAARIDQVQQQLGADVIAPANARCQAAISEARGDAAKIIEEGKATAQVLSRITGAWKQAGKDARDVFLMQKLNTMVDTLTKTVESVRVDKLTVLGVGGASGGNGAGANAGLAPKLIGANEQLKAALGVDLLGAVQERLGASTPGDDAGKHDGRQQAVAAEQAERAQQAEQAELRRQETARRQRQQRQAQQQPAAAGELHLPQPARPPQPAHRARPPFPPAHR